MSNKKSLLYGLGSGMIAGSVLLQLMSFAPAANQGLSKEDLQQPAAETMTREQIKEKASVYFNVYEKDVKVYLQPQVDALVQQRVNEELEKERAKPVEPVREVYINVTSGLVLWQVSDLLYQSGVIADKKTFEEEMRKRRLAGSINTGVHVFKGPQTLEQVITGLTEK
ncbi:hypothetical protein P9314_18845 [Paenibacillus validus]|uniref:Uncharacterized protein n=1 Tax=Paenibacillus validus TaxID=44253 RepID=A0A7X2Z8V8_9BACL|nr:MULTISPECIES: hypothetical protein [Paenibacillus]MED4602711.1 hypothetical protein [Paenibacillus validus]MED4607140.1 hypothetical protein [Paenibacillus validus]MUG70499.1 hypothetical protein [Paenibacillus validus]